MPRERAVDSHIGCQGQPRRTDREIAELAGRQHGVVSRAQLLDLGLTCDAVDKRLAAGRLHLTHRGVYAVGHRLLSRRGRWAAAVLAAGPDAYLSHRAAAALWGILRSSRIEIIVPGPRRSRPGIRFHRHSLQPDEVTIVDAIPVTTVPRTLFDLAATESRHDLERAVHEADYLRLDDPLSLSDLISRYPGHRGNCAVRAIVQARQSDMYVSREEFVDRFLTLMARYGLAKPEDTVWMTIAGRRFEVDCVWRDQKLMVELDGWAAHGTRRAYERDRARDRFLVRHGWRVIRITWDQLRDDPQGVAADIAALLYSA